jgi:hypothetical protein
MFHQTGKRSSRNAWVDERLYACVADLPDGRWRADRKAFIFYLKLSAKPVRPKVASRSSAFALARDSC